MFQVHAFPYDGNLSTFIVECEEGAWRRAGLDQADEAQSIAYCEKLFADELRGHALMSNNSRWISFVTVRNQSWSHGNTVLLGDAAHTAHFSIGSGTKLAMEDAISLANALERHGDDLHTAMAAYESERRPAVEAFQEAALRSLTYFENVKRYAHLEPVQFAFHLLSRSGRASYGNLRQRDPYFVDRVSRWFAEANGNETSREVRTVVTPLPMLVPLTLRGTTLANRVVLSPPPTYAADDGTPDERYLDTLVDEALGGAALIMTQPTAVSAQGRMTEGCSGIYLPEHVAAWLYESPQGGAPATSDTDGATGCFNYDAGDLAMVQQAESVEQRQPLIIESLSARQDGEGAGYCRSGFGVARRVRILADSSQLSTTVDGAVIPPWGPAGAPPGSVNSVTVIRRGEEFIPAPIPGKIKGFQLLNGDVVVALGSAGGGVGDALDRETELVRRDVYKGYVSAERARDVYGVAIENNEVDLEKTRRLREGIKGKRQYFTISDGADEFDGRGCRVGLIGATDAAGIGVSNGDMFEYVTTSTAPLRAWATIVDGQSEGTLPLGPIGRGILKIEAGAKVWARRLPIASAQA